jgi:hypothetical protein
MADKQVPLSIVLNFVDNATAGVRAFKSRVDAITAPIKQLGGSLSGLAKEAGLHNVIDGFKGVGGAVKDVAEKLAVVGGVAATATAALVHMVGEFDDLGDLADRLGVHVDFLAQLRFAAERSGASVEQLDAGLQTLSQNMGQARAGTGRLLAFLNDVSPALRKQLLATKSNEEAFLLLSDAMAKLPTDKAAALAQKAVGDSALAPLLKQGAKGIAELMQEYSELAGSQQKAADGAGKVDDGFKRLKASTQGIKAALVTGLTPALEKIVDKLTKWFVDHRADVEKWATQIGDELPGAIQKVLKWVGKAFDKVTDFVDSIGGLDTIVVGAAATIAGPMVTSLVTLGVELVKVTALAAAFTKEMEAANAAQAPKPVGLIGRVLRDLPQIDDEDRKMAEHLFPGSFPEFSQGRTPRSILQPILDEHERLARPLLDSSRGLGPLLGQSLQLSGPTVQAEQAQARIQIDISNLPPGSRVKTDPRNTADVDLNTGYQMGGL